MTPNQALSARREGRVRYGDLANKISIGTAAAYLAKDTFKENLPFTFSTSLYEDFDPYTNPTFGDKLLYNLYYATASNTYNFNGSEVQFWIEFKDYNRGTPKSGDLLKAIVMVNTWLTNEALDLPHAAPRPTYTSKFKSYHVNYHFLTAVRRQMSGDIAAGTSAFSHEEEAFYDKFNRYQSGEEFTGVDDLKLKVFEYWLINEVAGNEQPQLIRDYNTNHSWYKILEQG